MTNIAFVEKWNYNQRVRLEQDSKPGSEVHQHLCAESLRGPVIWDLWGMNREEECGSIPRPIVPPPAVPNPRPAPICLSASGEDNRVESSSGAQQRVSAFKDATGTRLRCIALTDSVTGRKSGAGYYVCSFVRLVWAAYGCMDAIVSPPALHLCSTLKYFDRHSWFPEDQSSWLLITWRLLYY